MKKKLLVLVIALLSLLLILTGCGQSGTTEDTGGGSQETPDSGDNGGGDYHVVLSLADHLGPEHPYMKYASVKFMDLVEERTNGQVEFEYYPSTQAGAMKDQVNMMQSGIVDMSSSPAAIFAEQLPLSNVGNLPGWGISTEDLALAFYELATDESSALYQNDFESNGIKMLFCGCFPLYQLQSNKPVNDVEDLESLIVRSPGGVFEFILQALGTSVITVPPTELYEAMQKGTVDAMYSPQESLIPQALNEVMTYSTGNMDLNSFVMMWDISIDTWNELPADIQEILVECGREVTETFSADLYTVYDEAQTQLEEQGIEYTYFTDEQLAEMHEMVSVVPDEWKAAMDEKGLAGTETYDAFAAIVEKYK